MKIKMGNSSFDYNILLIIFSILSPTILFPGGKIRIIILGMGLLFFMFITLKIKKIFISKIVILVITTSFITVLLNSDKGNDFNIWLLSIVYCLVIIYEFNLNFEKDAIELDLKNYLEIFVYFSIINLFVGLMSYHFDIFKWAVTYSILIGQKSVIGFFRNPNFFSTVCSFSIVFSYILNKGIYKRSKKVLLFNIIFQSYGLILSRGRTSLLFTLIFFLCIFFSDKKYRISKIIGFLMILIIFSMNFQRLSPYLIKNPERILSGREIIWPIALEISKENFFWGVGNSNLISEIEKKIIINYPNMKGLGTHNSYLSILVSNGVIFTLGIIIIIIKTLTRFFYIKKRSEENQVYNYVNYFIISYCIAMIFESWLIYYFYFTSIYFWYYIYISNYMYKQIKLRG